jgi:hypothetical protein
MEVPAGDSDYEAPGCVGEAVASILLFFESPFNYSRAKNARMTAFAQHRWETVIDTLNTDIDGLDAVIASRTDAVRKLVRQKTAKARNDASALLRQRQGFVATRTTRCAQLTRAELFIAALSSKSLDHELLLATKQTADIMTTSDNPKQLRALENALDVVQDGMDSAQDITEAFRDGFATQSISDDDLLAEFMAVDDTEDLDAETAESPTGGFARERAASHSATTAPTTASRTAEAEAAGRVLLSTHTQAPVLPPVYRPPLHLSSMRAPTALPLAR